MIELAAILNFAGLFILFMCACIFIVLFVEWATQGGKRLEFLIPKVDRRCNGCTVIN